MTNIPGTDAAAARLHARMAKPVAYTGAGLTGDIVAAVKADVSAQSFDRSGQSLREASFEVRKEALPADPGKGNLIAENSGAGRIWSVIDVAERDDVDAWLLTVEIAS